MDSPAQVLVHPSQFPDQIRRDLLGSLRTRKLNHKFLYEGVKQTQRWLALHEAHSPSRADRDCAAVYDRGFEGVVARLTGRHVELVGLGCGGGKKDARLLTLLSKSAQEVFYIPADVSTAMVLVARQSAVEVIPQNRCSPLVLDLETTSDLSTLLDGLSGPNRVRLITFFGMMPNFEPDSILPRLAGVVKRGDLLLFSANLAPGPDYRQGVQQILPLYDNELTRNWLMGFLFDLGVEKTAGALRFVIEEHPAGSGLLRVAAYYEFRSAREVSVEEERFMFRAGEAFRVFFSYRHTPALVTSLFQQHGLKVLDQWVTKSGEEGVFLAGRS